MPKQRCPQCGCQNDASQKQCRLCGSRIDPDVAAFEEVQARAVVRSQGGFKGFVLIALGIVVVIGLGAVIFGVVSSNRVLEGAKKTVTGESATDGWQRITDDSGGFTASLPGTPTKQKTEDLTTWTAKVGSDTIVTISYQPFAKVFPAAASPSGTVPAKDALNSYVNADIGKIDVSDRTTIVVAGKNPEVDIISRKELVVGSNPAVFVEYNNQVKDNATMAVLRTDQTQRVYNKSLFIVKGDRLYTITVSSLIKGVEQYPRTAGEFAFTS